MNSIAPIAWRRIFSFLLIAACLPMGWQRIANLSHFYRLLGIEPAHSDLNDWLLEVKLSHEAMIISGFQSYIPAQYKRLYDNQWQPPTVDILLYRNRQLPAILIESDLIFPSYFSDEIRLRGLNSPEQEKMHTQGNAFYKKLRGNRLFPYLLASSGRELTATNWLPHSEDGYSVYVNPHAFSENVLTRSQVGKSSFSEDQPAKDYVAWQKSRAAGKMRGVLFRWNQPATVSLLHLTTFEDDAPEFVAEIEDAAHGSSTIPFICRSEYSATSTERFLHITPPRDISAVTIRLADGSPFESGAIVDLRAYAPAPSGLNTSKISFELKPKSPEKIPLDRWQNLVSMLPRPDAGVMLTADEPLEFTLVPRMKLALRDITLVFDATDTASVGAECVSFFEDGSQEALTGSFHHLHNPDGAYYRLQSMSTKTVRNVSCRIYLRDSHQSPLRLWQVSTGVEPVMP